MNRLFRFFDRTVPALLMAAGLTLLAAGLLSWSEPVLGERLTRPSATATAGSVAEGPQLPSASPPPPASGESLAPSSAPAPSPPTPSEGASAPPVPSEQVPSGAPAASPSAAASLVPGGPSAPSAPLPSTVPPPPPEATPAPDPAAVATRVVVPSERIDLPVISRQQRVPGQGPDLYPPCNVAIFHDAFQQPGRPGTTYLYGHARTGMFLPLLEASERQDGASLLGALVEVYTAADRLYVYEIFQVKRHALDFSLALDVPPGEHRLILQTSEGPRGTVPKLQVAARLVTELPATPQEARPRPRPVACYS